MIATQIGEKILDCRFEPEREINKQEFLSDVGSRYKPDWANLVEAPLIHDLTISPMGSGNIPRAWSGNADTHVRENDDGELHVLEPLEMLPSHFVDVEYQAGDAITRAIHDYVAEPLTS